MSVRESLHERVAWPDLIGVALMSIAAPWIAAYMHSAFVFHAGFRIYNAELGGEYFHGSKPPEPGISTVLMWFVVCMVPAMPTCLVLLAFRKMAVYRWLAWVCCIILWTWVCFKMEIAYH